MGLIRVNIELINADDTAVASRGFIKQEEIRRITTPALVDSGAYMLCINENIANQLGLKTIETEEAILADGSLKRVNIVGPIEIRFGNRRTHQDAMILPGNSEVFLGAIPMEDMDVVIDPLKQTLTPHPDRPYMAGTVLKGIR
ncbi:MAG: aspartyl protease family protein [Bacteroidota bacterium]|nr:aspartyl protease family protein [Bacteroidota bacterium]